VLGPEEEDVAESLALLARDKGLVQVSGGVTSPRFTTLDDGGYFFRTCPSSLVTATTLARRMIQDGMRRVSFLYVPNDFGSAFVASAAVAFQSECGAIVSQSSTAPVSVQPDEQDYRELLAPLLALEPDALLLATDPVSGARLVRDCGLLGGRGRLYFAPTLMTEVFAREVPAGSIEGMVGVSAISGADADAFAQAYAEWSGEAPAQAAYFYYDAMALLALAIEKAHRDAGEMPTGEQLRAALPAVSGPPGVQVRWNETDRALALVRAGEEIDYQGASGEVNLDERGDVALAQVDFWAVRGHAIVRESR
jgi:ABC-type branched-subunit amino acid transport system substrate-binding protein